MDSCGLYWLCRNKLLVHCLGMHPPRKMILKQQLVPKLVVRSFSIDWILCRGSYKYSIPKAKPKPLEEVVHSFFGEKVRSKMLYIPKTAILIGHMISFHDWTEPLGLRRDTTMPMAIKWRGRWWTTLNKQAHEWLLIIQPWLLLAFD